MSKCLKDGVKLLIEAKETGETTEVSLKFSGELPCKTCVFTTLQLVAEKVLKQIAKDDGQDVATKFIIPTMMTFAEIVGAGVATVGFDIGDDKKDDTEATLKDMLKFTVE